MIQRQYLSVFVTITTTFLLYLILVRSLTIEDFALYSFAFSFIGVVGVISELGFKQYILTLHKRSDIEQTLRIFSFNLIVSFLSIIILLQILYEDDILRTLSICALSYSLMILFENYMAFKRALGNFDGEANARILSRILLLLIVLAFSLMSLSVNYFISTLFIVSTIVLLYENAFRGLIPSFGKYFQTIKKVMPFFFQYVFFVIFFKVDILLMEYFNAGSAYIANYALNFRIQDVFILLTIPSANFFLMLVKDKSPEHNIRQHIWNHSYIVIFLSLIIYFLSFLFLEDLIGFFFGKNYENVASIFLVFCFAIPFILFNSIISQIIVLRNMIWFFTTGYFFITFAKIFIFFFMFDGVSLKFPAYLNLSLEAIFSIYLLFLYIYSSRNKML